MQFTCHKSKGFLIIELLIALGLLATFVLLISKFQLQVRLYKKAAHQLYLATNLCEDVVEELWARQRVAENRKEMMGEFEVETTFVPGPVAAFWYVQVCANWQNVLQQKQKISLDAICVR